MTTTKKNEIKTDDPTDHSAEATEKAQLNARIAQLEAEKSGLQNLIIQINEIFKKESNLMNVAAHDMESGDNILAGMKLRELSEIIENNHSALTSIVEGWKK